MVHLQHIVTCVLCVLLLAACQSKKEEAPVLSPSEQSIFRLQETADASPNDAQSWYALANALFDDRQLERARDTYRKASEIDPSDARIHTNLGLTLRRLGDIPGAIASYERARVLDPSNTTLLTNMYTLYELSGESALAFSTLEQLHNAAPNDLEIMLQYADGLYMCSRYSPAATLYARLASAVPQLDRAHFRHGMCLYKLNAHDRAIQIWEAALSVNPNNVAVLQALPVFYMERQEWAQAWASVRRCQTAGVAVDGAVIERLQNESGQIGPE